MGKDRAGAQPRLGRVRVVVSGRVQGVGFRYHVLTVARALGLRGWVRNAGSSEVEALAEGPIEALDQFLAALREGPARARVFDVSVRHQGYVGDLPAFTVRSSVWRPGGPAPHSQE